MCVCLPPYACEQLNEYIHNNLSCVTSLIVKRLVFHGSVTQEGKSKTNIQLAFYSNSQMCASLSSRSRCSPVASVLGEDLLGQLGVRDSSLVGAKEEACKGFRIPGRWKGHRSVPPSFCAADKVPADNFLSITLGPQERSPPPAPKCFSCSLLC